MERILRRISLYFLIVFGVEIVALVWGLFWFQSIETADQLKQVEILASMLAAFGSLCLTSGLVYHNFRQHPELRIMNTIIDPLDANGQKVVETEYLGRGFRKNSATGQYEPIDLTRPKIEHTTLKIKSYWMVRCTSKPAKIRVHTDVCNIGTNETTVHEYIIEQIEPANRTVGIYSCQEALSHQQKMLVEFDYPEDLSQIEAGKHKFKITVLGSTEKRTKRLQVVLSEDGKTLRWYQYDC